MSQRLVYMTQQGYERLEKELDYLKKVRRQEVAHRLHNALEEGELIENAELEEARREQAFLEGRIYDLEQQLRYAQIINETNLDKDHVTLGSHVLLQEEGASTPEEYQVVGSAEADPAEGKISNESPLGSALLNTKVGDKALVRAPDGDIVFTILEIK